MIRTRIKICGVREVDTAQAAVEAGADAIGLVFAAGSPRLVSREQAKKVVEALPAMVEPVGLFVDAPLPLVRETAAQVGLRTVQLHGHETSKFAAKLTELRVIKAMAFDGAELKACAARWRRGHGLTHLAGLLWDAPPPDAWALPGGSGRPFDWHELVELRDAGALDDLPPMILAGGLTPDNVGEAIRVVRPYAVDVSSGVESSRGVKDAGKIRAFCAAVRQADAQI